MGLFAVPEANESKARPADQEIEKERKITLQSICGSQWHSEGVGSLAVICCALWSLCVAPAKMQSS